VAPSFENGVGAGLFDFEMHWRVGENSIPALGGGSLQGIFVVGFIMFVVLMPFFALKEIGRDMGDGKLYEPFFVRRAKYALLQP
jgi:hypothetical protein